MKIFISILTAGLCLPFAGRAQTFDFTADFNTPGYSVAKAYLMPADGDPQQDAAELTATGKSRYSAPVRTNSGGIYNFVCNDGQSQAMFPVYVPVGKKKSSLKIVLNEGIPANGAKDTPNKALQALADSQAEVGKKLIRNFENLDNDALRRLIKGYVATGDSLAALPGLPEAVAQYIRTASLVNANDLLAMADYLAGRAKRKLGFGASDLFDHPERLLDSDMAAWFAGTPRIAAQFINAATLPEQLQAVNGSYTRPAIVSELTDHYVRQFLDRHDYATKYNEGDELLTALTSRYGLDGKYLDLYRQRKATVSGKPFPDVTLVDAQGNKVDFGSFKGKYVYVDLWASWCGPCVKEIPALKQLEQELGEGNVVFVSISTDSQPEPWHKAMEKHKVSGVQLYDESHTLPEKLNVKGIPHFLIYGPDGSLHTYNAPRPSDVRTLPLLKSLR